MPPRLGTPVAPFLIALHIFCGADFANDSAALPAAPCADGWAFKPPLEIAPPEVKNGGWPKNTVDRFILAKLEARGITPAPEAPRSRLVRRVYLDLIGTPPTVEEAKSFENDPSTDAFEKLVDRLLASPHYGERWARHWLDLARYAESEGFKADETRPNAWRFRDYVIESLNSDKPYDRFVKEQIAGDELWPDDPQARIATGFNRHYPDESNARNLFQRRQEILTDITDTTGSVFLGMTIGCARCHDHKYDPITQKDYYGLQAFFADLRADDQIPVVTPEALREHQVKLAAWEEKTRSIREKMAALEQPRREGIIRDYADKYPEEIRASLAKPPGQRTPMDWLLYYKSGQYLLPGPQYIADTGAVIGGMKGEERKRWEELKKELDAFNSIKPAELPLGIGITDAGTEAPPSYVLRGGMYDSPKDRVEPAFLSAIETKPPVTSQTANPLTTGRRAALANWIASPANPLTARVMVNRLWHYHFGRGIAASPSDLGKTGEPPTHPELLDWLSREFVKSGWSLKGMHRLIVTSATYRQDSRAAQSAKDIDSDGRLLSHYPRHRLEAEVIRDSSLAVAGLLNEKLGGPSIFADLPAGMETRGGWKTSNDPAERNRRSVYVFVRRNTRYPMFQTLDMPDTHESCSRRNVTTSPLQALTLMNAKLSLEWAQAFVEKVLREAGGSTEAQIQNACLKAYCRSASKEEVDLMTGFLDRQTKILVERRIAGQKLAVPKEMPRKLKDEQGAALVDLCQMILNANEFVYVE